MTIPRASSGSRVAAIAIDQAFSSASNGLIVYAVAIVSTPQFFGIVSVLMTSIIVILACTRGALGTPLLLKSNQSEDALRQEAMYSVICAFAVSAPLAVGMCVLAREIGVAGLVLALSAPFLCAQDVLRHLAIAIDRPTVAAVWDGVWAIGTLGLLITAWLDHEMPAAFALAGWGLLAVIAFLGLAVTFRVPVRLSGFLTWLRADAWNRVRYGIDLGLEPFGLLIVLAIVSILLNAEATGALRGSSALLAPLAIVGATIQLAIISESVRRAARPERVWRVLLRIVSAVTAVTLAAGACILLIPAEIGFYLLGESFLSARHVLPATLAEYVAASVLFCLTVFLRTFNRSGPALVLKLTLLTLLVASTVITCLWLKSPLGVGCGLAFANAVVAIGGLAVIKPWRKVLSAAAP